MNWNIEFSPLLPLSALVVLALAGGVLVTLLYWRRMRGASLRMLSLVFLILALMNPALRQEEREPLADIVVVAIDESASQHVAGRLALTREVRKQLGEELDSIADLEIRWVTTPGPGRASTSDGTTLFADLGKVLSDIPPNRLAGVVVVTDGRIHDVPETAEALGIQAPIHAIITGNAKETDRRLEVLRAPRFGLVGSVQTAKVRVTDDP
ncbi:MAG: hypothetical protein OEM91_07655, partial [Hyphomicrobiales bacterium]|nr:hypothetical protein [Hyphomicrobiales bacterium]